MKTKSQQEETPVPSRVESVVEDLSQQDVLPSSGSEVAPEMEALVDPESEGSSWDGPLGESGHRASRIPLEDEINPVELLVNQGADEAEEELRDLDEEEELEEEADETAL